jgi:hypothetical protein
MVSLHQHNLLRDVLALLWSAEADDVGGSRVGLLVAVRDTHSTTDRNIEASETTIAVDNGNEADVVGKDIDVIGRRYRNRNLELLKCVRWMMCNSHMS